uniref:Splicing factor 3B subunit 3 n=1 Tax=Panagrellus redivivus TaxID=6233 RepID=A0A7E4WAP3_PANRE
MHLYHLSLQPPSNIVCAVHGSFAGISKQQEVVVARGSILQLLVCDSRSGKINVKCSHDVFGIIRSLAAFKLTGGSKDYIVVGSDSGRFVILEYIPNKNCFERVHQETYGKTGCRRIVPGQYLATDPKGRAVLIGAVERQKLVYIMNRDSEANLTISSPLEAHRNFSVCYDVIGMDVGFENPTFACLEVEYEEVDQDPTGEAARNVEQCLTFYELDLGLNHVVRKYSEPLPERGNHLIPVPGGNDGPSGVIVCCQNVIVYKNLGEQQDIRVPLPRRRNDIEYEDTPLLVIASAAHKTKSIYFFLIQLENGDLFKVTLDTEGDIVTDMHLKYFDTVPPANAMCILKTGFLFVAAEFGNHQLYQIARLGTDDAEPDFSSRSTKAGLYNVRDLMNLVMVDTMDSLDPLIQTQVADWANEDAPQIYAICGRGGRSTLRVLRNGLEIAEMAVSELPGNPVAVWTVRRTVDDQYHSYIIVSFANATLVLAIQDSIEEVPDSGFLGTAPTIGCGLIGDDSLLQVYPGGLRHIKSDRRINEWKTPARRYIVNCAINRRQVVIALSGGVIVYFELDLTNQLREFSDHHAFESDILCMSISEIPEGELRSRFLTVGLADNTVRVISLDPTDCLQRLGVQSVQGDPSSLLIIETPDDTGAAPVLHMNIGLSNGCLIRTTIDQVTGDLADTRTRYLGTKPVSLYKVTVEGKDAVIATSSRSWVLYNYQNRFHLTPLSYMPLESAAPFVSPQCAEGIVAVGKSTLRILAFEKLGAVFNQTTHRLKFTPRKFVSLFGTDNLIVVEADHAAFTEKAKADRKAALVEGAEAAVQAARHDVNQQYNAQELRELYRNLDNDESQHGLPKNRNGTWASSIRLINATRGNTLCHYELPEGEAAMCVELVQFRSQPDSVFVLVGCASNLQLVPHHNPQAGCVYTFLVSKAVQGFEFIHRTVLDSPVYSIHAFKGVALIGVGRMLRLYDFGKKRLLMKCENKSLSSSLIPEDMEHLF